MVIENIILDDDTDKIKKNYFIFDKQTDKLVTRTLVACAFRKPDAITKSLTEFES